MDIQNELSDQERALIAARLLVEQRERFDGVRKAAYTAAGVNPATWTRATTGERVRPDRMVMIVKSLWPASRGDWSQVPAPTGSRPHNSYDGPTWIADSEGPWTPDLVRLKDYIDERTNDLEDRVRELEQMMLEAADPDVEIVVRPFNAETGPDADHMGDVDAQEAKTQARPTRRRAGLN